MEKYSTQVAYFTAALTTFFGSITLQDVSILAGMVAAVGTFAVNWYYKAKEFERNAEK